MTFLNVTQGRNARSDPLLVSSTSRRVMKTNRLQRIFLILVAAEARLAGRCSCHDLVGPGFQLRRVLFQRGVGVVEHPQPPVLLADAQTGLVRLQHSSCQQALAP